jgi:hypothetical protein
VKSRNFKVLYVAQDAVCRVLRLSLTRIKGYISEQVRCSNLVRNIASLQASSKLRAVLNGFRSLNSKAKKLGKLAKLISNIQRSNSLNALQRIKSFSFGTKLGERTMKKGVLPSLLQALLRNKLGHCIGRIRTFQQAKSNLLWKLCERVSARVLIKIN